MDEVTSFVDGYYVCSFSCFFVLVVLNLCFYCLLGLWFGLFTVCVFLFA